MSVSTTEDAATIEREIRRTQDDISSTVQKIGNQLSVKNVFNALLDKADENNVDAKMVLDGARRNPIALGLIAAGTIWLISDRDSKIPSLRSKSAEADNDTYGDIDADHHKYISHMSSVEPRADEEHSEYQRRRDMARSTFFMTERNHDEDESSYRQRLDAITDKFREKRSAWADRSADMQMAAKQKAQDAAHKAVDLYGENPLVGGILAAAIGAAFGSALPATRKEKEILGPVGQKAREVVSEHTEQVTAQARTTKDELLDKADAVIAGNSTDDNEPVLNSFNSSGGSSPTTGY